MSVYVGRSAPAKQRRVPSTSPGNQSLPRLTTTDRSAVSPARVVFRDKRSGFRLGCFCFCFSFQRNKSAWVFFFSPPTQRQRSFFPPLARLNFGAARPNEIQLKRTRRHFVISLNSQIRTDHRPRYFPPRRVQRAKALERTGARRKKAPCPRACDAAVTSLIRAAELAPWPPACLPSPPGSCSTAMGHSDWQLSKKLASPAGKGPALMLIC